VRSTEAPKRTITRSAGFGTTDVAPRMASVATPVLSFAGGELDVPAELLSHGGQELIGEVGLPA
jgi:hypothetical protein